MNRLKERVDRELSDVEMTPALADRIAKRRAKRVKKKLTVALAAALVLVLVAGIAYATGVFASIFRGMKGMYGNSGDEKYEVMDELSDAGSAAEALTVAPGATLSIRQTYYDGEQLAIGYSVEGVAAADMTFGPGHPEFAEFQEAVMGEESAAVVYLGDILTDEERAQFEKTLAETGAAGFVCQYVYLGDHVTLEDGTDVANFVDTPVEGGTYIEFDAPLADAARDKDSLTLVLDVRAQSLYYYKDKAGSYVMTGPVRSQAMTVEVPRSTDRVNWYAGSYAGETYSASARLLVTLVNARATIEMKIPAEYWIPWDEVDKRLQDGADLLVDYELVVDGTVCAGDLSETERDDGRTMELEYELHADGAADIRLRPVYSVSGEHPDEDIILE